MGPAGQVNHIQMDGENVKLQHASTLHTMIIIIYNPQSSAIIQLSSSSVSYLD